MHPAAKVHLAGYVLIVASLVAAVLIDKRRPSSEHRLLYILGYLGKGLNIQAILGVLGVSALCLGAALIPEGTVIFIPLMLRDGLRLVYALFWFLPLVTGWLYITELIKNFRQMNFIQRAGQIIKAAAIWALASVFFVGSVDDFRSTIQNSHGWGLLFFLGSDPRHSGIVLVRWSLVFLLGLGIESIGTKIKLYGRPNP